ncbi:P-loop containing nucleoside triphosphate hydrolase protein [Mycena galericulata]|nr:P-loop containing nucleoside triphosphate hydrolase protein [Mycena galericulata]
MDFPADDFIDIWADGDNEFHRSWSVQASAKHSSPSLQAFNALKKIYPNHSIVTTPQDVRRLPTVLSSRLPNAPLVTTARVNLIGRVDGTVTGNIVDLIEFGAFQAAWKDYDFTIYTLTWVLGFSITTMHFILHEGPETPTRALVLASGLYDQSLHEEIWDHSLWEDVQSADWKDVILKDEFKTNLKKDIYGFFKSEAIYKELAIPWKRGLIMWGPPGNGKTISIKVIMKTCDALGFAPLYVKSFQILRTTARLQGEEASMLNVFNKARQLAPCVIVLEDLDALINDRNRSFFLNQLDDREERALYLKSNKDIDFADSLVDEVADMTAKFSFAYLKEAFVSSLAKRDFRPLFDTLSDVRPFAVFPPSSPQPPLSAGERNIRALLDRLASEGSSNVDSLRVVRQQLDALRAWDLPQTQYFGQPKLD